MTEEYFSIEYYEDLYYSEPSRILRLFSASERYTILLIASYLQAKGYKWFCYHGLEYYYHRKRDKAFSWHTIERNIRRLTYTYNLFTPRHSRYSRNNKKGCFNPTKSFYIVLDILRPRPAPEGIDASTEADDQTFWAGGRI